MKIHVNQCELNSPPPFRAEGIKYHNSPTTVQIDAYVHLYSVARSMTQSAYQIDSAGYLFFCARWKSYTMARLHPLTLANVARAETALIIMMLLSTPTNRRCPFDSQMIFWADSIMSAKGA